jgi:hypothetical protein
MFEAAQTFPPSSWIEEGCGCELVLGRGGMTSGTVVARTRYRVTRGGTNFPTMQSARGKWRVQAGVYRHRDGAGRPQRDSRCSTRASTNFPTMQPQLVAAAPLKCHFSAPGHGPDRRHGCSPQRARRHKPSHHAAMQRGLANAGGPRRRSATLSGATARHSARASTNFPTVQSPVGPEMAE